MKLEREQYLTPPEAAAMMMCSALHVRKLIRGQKLPTYKVGTRSYIPRDAVEAYIQEHIFPVLAPGENRRTSEDR